MTDLAYLAAHYMDRLASLHQVCPTSGRSPPSGDLTSTISAQLENPLFMLEEAIGNLEWQHRDLPDRAIYKEIALLTQAILEAKQIFLAWKKDPQAPGAPEGAAAVRHALDALEWTNLVVSEGSVAQTSEYLAVARHAVRRSAGYMTTLIEWIQRRPHQHDEQMGEKRRRLEEKPTGSNQAPAFATNSARPPLREPRLHRLPPERPPQHDRDQHGLRGAAPEESGEAAPFDVLKAQDILKKVVPFVEQEVAVQLNEALSHLVQWTPALWGHPIQLVESLEEDAFSAAETVPVEMPALNAENAMVTSGVELGETLPDAPSLPEVDEQAEQGEGFPVPITKGASSHRRRRLAAALASTSDSESS